jgi:hypothetical protein
VLRISKKFWDEVSGETSLGSRESKNYFSCILQVGMFLFFSINKKARTCELAKAPCTRVENP